jgi:manganese/iron transport system ATP-binding protein
VTNGATNAPAVEARDLWAGYDGQPALEAVAFNIEIGCLAGLVGPNGSGKSTLLRVILGLHKPWRGDVLVFGSSAPPDRRRLGYTPQSEEVDWSFPVTLLDVVLMGRYGRLGPLRRPTRADREIAWQALESVRLADLADRRIGELSGGQQRRALVARALAQEADLLLLDEPLAGLDAAAQHDLIALLEGLRHQGKTFLVATHDLSCVAADFDHAILLNRRVVAFGRPSDVFTEELLNATFQRHLLLVRLEGRTYVGHD